MRKHWPQQELDDFKELYPTMTAPELATYFGTTKQAIYVKANKMGLHKDQPCKIKLSQEQIWWLKRNFKDMRNEICAVYLGISVRSVVRLARFYGLEKTSQFMKDCQLHTAEKAKQSHLKNGTYPPKGFIIPGREKYYFKQGHIPHKKRAI